MTDGEHGLEQAHLTPLALRTATSCSFGEVSFMSEVLDPLRVKEHLRGDHADPELLDIRFPVLCPHVVKDDFHLPAVFGLDLPHDRLHHSARNAADRPKLDKSNERIARGFYTSTPPAFELCAFVQPAKTSMIES